MKPGQRAVILSVVDVQRQVVRFYQYRFVITCAGREWDFWVQDTDMASPVSRGDLSDIREVRRRVNRLFHRLNASEQEAFMRTAMHEDGARMGYSVGTPSGTFARLCEVLTEHEKRIFRGQKNERRRING